MHADERSAAVIELVGDDSGAVTRPLGAEADPAVIVANALGSAWSTFQLHPDPRGRIGFERAVETLAIAPSIEYLAVTADHFELKGVPVEAGHAGAGRLVDQLFLIGIAAVEFVDAPTADDLFHLFDTVRRPLPELDELGGPVALLRTTETSSIRLIETRALIEEHEPDETGEATDVRNVANPIDFSGDPEGFAAALIEVAGDDPARFADLVIDGYEQVHFLTDPLDPDERVEIVRTFVDMFFYLPARLQAPTISGVLAHHDEEPFRTFLDQFTSHELNDLAPLLDSVTHPLLREYARISSQNVTGPPEVTQLLEAVSDGSTIDEVVERRIAEVLGGHSDDSPASRSFRSLASALPARSRYRAVGIGVLQGLMHVESSDHDQRRLLRIWAGKVVSAIQADSAEAAHDWLDAILVDDAITPEDRHLARRGLSKVMSLAVATDLVEMLHTDPEAESAVRLLQRLASYAAPHVVELLAQESDRGRRRQLIEIAVQVARVDPQAFITRLTDPRWYLTRNLAIVLGRSEHPGAVHHLDDLRRHADERVRREAIRGLYALGHGADTRPFVDALQDPDSGVRKVAATLLRTTPRDGLPLQLEQALAAPGPAEAKVEIIGLLADLGSDDARAVLAGVRDSRAPRALRNAAAMALEGET